MKFGTFCSGIGAPEQAWLPLGWTPVFVSEIEPFPCAVLSHHMPSVPNLGDMTKVNGDDLGLAQRRERVFVVASLGDGNDSAAVLFDRECLSGNPAPSRETESRIASRLTRGADSSGAGGYAGRRREDDINIVAATLNSAGGNGGFRTEPGEHLVASTGDVSHCLNADGMGRLDYESETLVTHFLRADGFDASEDGTGRGTPLVPVAFNWQSGGSKARLSARESHIDALSAHQTPAVTHAIQERAVSENLENGPQGKGYQPDVAYTPEARNKVQAAQAGMAVRRLLPTECEALMGFPRNFTAVPFRGKVAADGPRYRALGNSMAVPVLAWIGQRIKAVHESRLP